MAKYFCDKITLTGQYGGYQYFTTRTGCFKVPLDKYRVTLRNLDHILEAAIADIEVVEGELSGNIEDRGDTENVRMDELQDQHKSADDSEKEDSVAATANTEDVSLYQKAEQNKSTDAAEASHRAVIQPAATPSETKESLISSEKSRSSHAPIGLMVLICCLMLSILAVIVLMLIQVVGIKKDVARLKTDVIAQGRYLRIIYNNLPNTDGIEYDLRSIKATLSVYSRTSPDTDQIESDLKAIKQKLNIYPY